MNGKSGNSISKAFFSLALIFVLLGCGEKIQPGNKGAASATAVRASTAVAELSAQAVVHEAVGTVTARTKAVLSAKIMGTVTAVHVRESDRVTEGQLLMEIDPRTVSAQRKQAEAGLAEARKAHEAAIAARDSAASMAELAKATYDRYVNLMKNESASRQEFDEVAARYRQAEAGLNQAKAMVEAVAEKVRQAEAAVAASRVMDSDSHITAPYEGVVTQRFVDPGSLAAPGSPLLAIRAVSGHRVDLTLPEHLTPLVKPGLSVMLTIPALSQPQITGRVMTIVPFSDPASRSFIAQIDIPAVAGLQEGQYARGRLEIGKSERLMIPHNALIKRGQLTGVYWIDPERKARFRLVRTGAVEGSDVEILSGLKPGDRYIREPNAQIVDGALVEGLS
ncbi:MAG: efflux RND transporter periplasmic adaptor subunit [Thermodesulfobacteriota bacterium]